MKITAFFILARQVLCSQAKKEAATSSMNLTLFDSPRHFPELPFLLEERRLA